MSHSKDRHHQHGAPRIGPGVHTPHGAAGHSPTHQPQAHPATAQQMPAHQPPEQQGPPAQPPPAAVPKQNAGGCLARLFWMVGGNAILLVSAYSISRSGRWFSAADVVFWLAAVTLAALRYVDVTRLGGLTASGKLASLTDWKRYALLLAAVCVILWLVAHTTTLLAKPM